jgi:parvulin-like peptidyl-prolyl isomerase
MIVRICVSAAVAMALVGCRGEPASRPLNNQSFYGQPVEPPESHAREIDKPGPIQTGAERVDDGLVAPPVPAVEPDKKSPPATVTPPVIPTTRSSVAPTTFPEATRPLSAKATTIPSATETHPAASTEPLPSGGFQIVGFVVAEVNSHPIFADDIVEQLNSALAAEARKNDREQFRVIAGQLIQRQLAILISNELEVAAAENKLKANDKKIADLMTAQWRSQEVVKAGGSVQMARENFKAQGLDFDKEVRKHYRENLVQVFNHKNVWPLIQVSANDMRAYYDRNIADFTQFGEATFRLIKIDPAQHGGRDAAMVIAKQIYQRAQTEDFAKLAGSDVNDDKAAREDGGLLQPLKKGSYVHEKVEAAVWKTKPGHITDIITDNGAYYIAKVESLKPGNVQPFDDLTVQSRITATLRSQQYQKLRYDYIDRLRKDAVVRGGSPSQLTVVIDMAMQGYSQWAK